MPAGTRTRIAALLVLVVSLLSWSALAQDTPPPTETPPPTTDPTLLTPLPTFTPTPSETPSLTPTSTWTETPVAVASETPTTTATLAAIDDVLLTPVVETPIVLTAETPVYPPVPLQPVRPPPSPPMRSAPPAAPQGLLNGYNDPRTVVTALYAVVAPDDAGELQSIIDTEVGGSPCNNYLVYLLEGDYFLNATLYFDHGCRVTIYGRGVGLTNIRRGNSLNDSMMQIWNNSVLALHHVTVRDGLATVDGQYASAGAVRILNDGTLETYDSDFVNNATTGFGGAVDNIGGEYLGFRTDFVGNQGVVGSAYYSYSYSETTQPYLQLDCTRFENNIGTAFTGALSSYNFGEGSNIHDSSFINNVIDTNDGWDGTVVHIHSYAYQYNEPIDALLDATGNWWNRSTGPQAWEVAYEFFGDINPKVDVSNWFSIAPNCEKTEPYPLPGDYCPAGGGGSFSALQDECPTPTPTATPIPTVRYSNDLLPPPDVGDDECPTGEAGRLECAEQVYDQYYVAFEAEYGRTPILQDLIAALYKEEIGLAFDSDESRAAFGNNFVNSCAGGCTRTQLIAWLASKQGWYNKGRQDGNAYVAILVTYAQQSTYLAIADSIVGETISWPGQCTTTNDDIPCDWGSWGLGDGDYTTIRDTSTSVEICTIVQYWRDGNPFANPPEAADNIPNNPPDFWVDYVFAVVTYNQDEAIGNTSTYVFPSPIPAWLNDAIKRALRQNTYYLGATCPGTQD